MELLSQKKDKKKEKFSNIIFRNGNSQDMIKMLNVSLTSSTISQLKSANLMKHFHLCYTSFQSNIGLVIVDFKPALMFSSFWL